MRDQDVRVADADPHGVVDVLHHIGRQHLGRVVTAHAFDIVAVAEPRAVVQEVTRQVAKDAAADFIALRRHRDGFGDGDVSVYVHVDRDVEALDPLLRRRAAREDEDA